jgi:hypothetical protein
MLNMPGNSPVCGFVVTLFNGNGDKALEVRGSSATVTGDGLFLVKGAELHYFTDGGAAKGKFFIFGEEMFLDDAKTRAFGESTVRISGEGFYAFGENWEFRRIAKIFVAKKNAKVFLDGGSMEFLK